MYDLDRRKLIPKFLAWIFRTTQIPVVTFYGLARPSNNQNSEVEKGHAADQCISGGYNEAFVFENWASYGPRY